MKTIPLKRYNVLANIRLNVIMAHYFRKRGNPTVADHYQTMAIRYADLLKPRKEQHHV